MFLKKYSFIYRSLLLWVGISSLATGQSDTIYYEGFTNQNGKGLGNTSGVNWSIDLSGAPNAMTFNVQSGDRFAGTNMDGSGTSGATGYWLSPQIDITGLSAPFASVLVDQAATGFESGDFIQLSYSLDGGAFVELVKLSGNFSAQYIRANVPTGDSIQIRVGINNNSSAETHYFDNVLLGDSTTCQQPNMVTNFMTTEQMRQIRLDWTIPPTCWDEALIIASESSISYKPGGSTSSIITNTNYKNGMEVVPGEFAMYAGAGNTVTLTNFDNQTQYFFKIFSRDGNNWGAGTEVSFTTTNLADSIPASSSGADCSDLFISEYREGSVPYNSIEIYNPSSSAINLSSYTLNMYGNGSASPTRTSSMVGVLAPGETFSATTNHPATNATLKSEADSVYSFPWAGIFTGDDAITLEKNGVIIDVIGVVGTDPGSEWTVTGTNGVNGSTNDYTLVRDSTVRKGQTNWGLSAANEWMVFPNSNVSFFGNHQMQACVVNEPGMDVVYSSGPLDFGPKMINTTETRIYTIDAQNIYDDIEIIAPAPYEVSLSPNGLFNDTLILFGGLNSQLDIYVKFNPTMVDNYNDSIMHTTPSADTVYAVLNGSGFDPYPHYQIAQVNGVDANGVADSANVAMSLSGVVYGVNLRPSGLQFTMIDATAGINVFNFSPVSAYNVQEGDSITLYGSLNQFNGLLQMAPDSVEFLKSNAVLKTPAVVAALGESTESDLVQLLEVYLVDATQWTNSGSGFNVDVTNGTDTFEVRIDNDVNLYGQPVPTGFLNITGIGGQFDNSSPYTEGYQLLPRYQTDITAIPATLTSNNDTLSFGNVSLGDTSAVLAYQLDGTYLTQNVTINAPANFEVSLDGINFSTSVMAMPDAMGLLDDSVYVRFIATSIGMVSDSISNVSDVAVWTHLNANVLDPYPAYDINMINGLDANLVADSSGVNTTLYGIVYGVNLRPAGLQFTLRDNTGGIAVFNFNGNFGYTVQEGDSIMVKGEIVQFNGLLEIEPDTLSLIASGKTLKQPTVVNNLGEATESDLIQINEVIVMDPTQWTNSGSGFNVDITNGTDVFEMRIDNDVNIYGQPAPVGYFNVTGIGGQFDPSAPYDTGYQVLPRYQADIVNLPASLSSLTATSLNFGSVVENDTSAAQFFVVDGEYLLGDLNIVTSAEFPISFNINGGYTDSLFIAQNNGSLQDTIYVRFAPSANISFTDSVVNLAGAARLSIDVTGTGFDPYPNYTVDQINNLDPNGEADSVNVDCELTGIVYGVNLRPAGLQFTLIDQTGGIAVFSSSKQFGYTVTEGDSISVSGRILQFNGLLEIEPDTIRLWSGGNTLNIPTVVTQLGEATESQLIQLDSVTIVNPAQWQTSGGSFNVNVSDGTNTYVMRIDEDTDIYGTPILTNSFRLTGIGTQFDPSIPYLSGYQIMPRYLLDIEELIGLEELGPLNGIQLYPNPVSSVLNVVSNIGFTEDVILNVYNVNGALVKSEESRSAGAKEISLEVSTLPAGTYVLQILSGAQSEQKIFIVK